jgi:hypothetical protein
MMENELIRHLLNSGYALDIESPKTYTKTYDNIRIAVQLQEDIHIVFMDNGDVQREYLSPPFTSIQDFESYIQDILGSKYTSPPFTSIQDLESYIQDILNPNEMYTTINDQDSRCMLNDTVIARILGK